MISSKTVITNRKKGRIIALLLIAFALITLLFKLTSVSFASTTPPRITPTGVATGAVPPPPTP